MQGRSEDERSLSFPPALAMPQQISASPSIPQRYGSSWLLGQSEAPLLAGAPGASGSSRLPGRLHRQRMAHGLAGPADSETGSGVIEQPPGIPEMDLLHMLTPRHRVDTRQMPAAASPLHLHSVLALPTNRHAADFGSSHSLGGHGLRGMPMLPSTYHGDAWSTELAEDLLHSLQADRLLDSLKGAGGPGSSLASPTAGCEAPRRAQTLHQHGPVSLPSRELDWDQPPSATGTSTAEMHGPPWPMQSHSAWQEPDSSKFQLHRMHTDVPPMPAVDPLEAGLGSWQPQLQPSMYRMRQEQHVNVQGRLSVGHSAEESSALADTGPDDPYHRHHVQPLTGQQQQQQQRAWQQMTTQAFASDLQNATLLQSVASQQLDRAALQDEAAKPWKARRLHARAGDEAAASPGWPARDPLLPATSSTDAGLSSAEPTGDRSLLDGSSPEASNLAHDSPSEAQRPASSEGLAAARPRRVSDRLLQLQSRSECYLLRLQLLVRHWDLADGPRLVSSCTESGRLSQALTSERHLHL